MRCIPLQITEAIRPCLPYPVRMGGLRAVDAVQVLSGIIDEPDRATPHGKGAAAILQQTAARAEWLRQAIGGRHSRTRLNQADPPPFTGARFTPIEPVAQTVDLLRHASGLGDVLGFPGRG
jgi:hypothetical protein